MSFISEHDYRPVISPREFDVLQQSDPAIRMRAEQSAIEEISSYLRTRYDVKAAFAAHEEHRNPMLVQITVNVTLYYLVKWLPNKLGSANRDELYKAAIEWLKSVQSGKASPDLPTYQPDPNNPNSGVHGSYPMKMGTMQKQIYDY